VSRNDSRNREYGRRRMWEEYKAGDAEKPDQKRSNLGPVATNKPGY
jgi:hypothetical protein